MEQTTLINLDNANLDVVLVICKRFLEDVASGKKINYFKKEAQEALDLILKIKQDRIFYPDL